MPLWRSSARSHETVSTGRHWKTCCGIAWSVDAETTAYSASPHFRKGYDNHQVKRDCQMGCQASLGRRSASTPSQPEALPTATKTSPNHSPTSYAALLLVWSVPLTLHLQVQDCHLSLLQEDRSSYCKKARDQKSAARIGGESRKHQLEVAHVDESVDTEYSLPLPCYAAHAYRSLCNSQ